MTIAASLENDLYVMNLFLACLGVDKSQLVIIKTFWCRQCGGNSYGTTNPHKPEPEWIRECHQCRFQWPAEDDWRHFVLVIRRDFSSKEEYQRAP